MHVSKRKKVQKQIVDLLSLVLLDRNETNLSYLVKARFRFR